MRWVTYLKRCMLLALAGSLIACMASHQRAQDGVTMSDNAVKLKQSVQWLMSPQDGSAPYLIQVSQPSGPVPEQGYAVLYVLDGNARFPLMVAARDTLMRKGPDDPGLPLLIVGVGYPETDDFNFERRAADYLPAMGSADTGASLTPGAVSESSQGAARFLAFIQSTLKPAIEQQYPVNHAQETLFGHSYGGLFTLYALLNQPDSFDHYMALSPSLWWHQGVLKQDIEAFQADRFKPDVFIGVGALEQMPHQEVDAARAERMVDYAMVDNARWAAQQLQQSGLTSVQFRRYAGASHGSVLWPGAQSLMLWLQSFDVP